MNAAAVASDLADMAESLRRLAPAVEDADRIDRLRKFEELRGVLAAVQAETIVALAGSQRQSQLAAGVPAGRADRGIAAQVAFALRVSAHRGAKELHLARRLCSDLPGTLAAPRSGATSPWRAQLVARETEVLGPDHRRTVDAELSGRLSGWSDREVEAQARRAAYRLDPHAAVARAARAESERRVTTRPAPDTMAYLTLLGPCAGVVAAAASLARSADTLVTDGDGRSRSQIIADIALQRLTGQASADAVPVEINLVMPADLLFGDGMDERDSEIKSQSPGSATTLDSTLPAGDEHPATTGFVRVHPAASSPSSSDPCDLQGSGCEPSSQWAELLGFGPVPAAWARQLALGRGDEPRWIRRLFTSPDGRRLVQMDSHRRTFSPNQRLFLRLRDGTCRLPFCDAPIRQADHVVPHARGGRTDVINGQGNCEGHNYASEAPGWAQAGEADGAIVTQTPTGHRYVSEPRCLPAPVATTSPRTETRLPRAERPTERPWRTAEERLEALFASGRLRPVA